MNTKSLRNSAQRGYRQHSESSQSGLQVVRDRRSLDDTAPPTVAPMSQTPENIAPDSQAQSLDLYMEAMKKMLPSLPAGASVFVFAITLPASTNAAPEAGAPPALAISRDDAPPSETSTAKPKGAAELPAASLKRTPLELVRVERSERPNRLRKTAEWAELVGMSARALRRAVDNGALAHEAKPDGRDHGATVIRAEVLEAFLALVEAVDRGACDTPPWWKDVFGKKTWAHTA